MRGERWLTPWGQEQQPGLARDPAICHALFGYLADGPGTPGGKPARSQAPREEFLARYDRWLHQRKCEVLALPGRERQQVVRGLLQQFDGVVAALDQGVYTDLSTLDPAPVALNIPQSGRIVSAPPLLIPIARWFIEQIERPGPDRPVGPNPEGSRDGSGEDWNTRLGVPQYRTQSDNLASPEATCNVNALAMVLERLGYGRPEVMAAIDRTLRQKYWKEVLKNKKTASPEELSSFELPPTYFQEQVQIYLQKEYKDNASEGEEYLRPRGRLWPTDQAQRESEEERVSADYQGSAQMEDLLDFLRYLKQPGWGERSGAFIGEHSDDLIDELDPNEADRPRLTQLFPGDVVWAHARERMQQCLSDGGAAMLSLYHKSKAKNRLKDSHIIAVQRVTDDGLVVDDPYGAIRNTYDARVAESDAFAPAEVRDHKRPADFKNQVDETRKPGQEATEVGDDWQVEYAQNLTDAESLGDSHLVPNAVFERAWKYVRLYERPSVVQARTSRELALRKATH